MSNSIATTGGISTAGAALIPVIHWLFPTIPDAVSVSISAGIIVLAHTLHELAVRKGWYPDDASTPVAADPKV